MLRPLLLLVCFITSTKLLASPDYLTVTWENDLFAGKDGGYTNGLAVSWAHGDFETFSHDNTPDWILALSKNLYISNMENKRRAISYTVAQIMQTP